MGDNSQAEKQTGCGLFNLVFGRRRRSTSTAPLSRVIPSRKIQNDEQADRIVERPGKRHLNFHHRHNPTAPKTNAAPATKTTPRKTPQAGPGCGLSGELETMITDYQRARGGPGLVRASSSNLMLYGNLGNLRQGGKPEHHPKYATSVMGNVVSKPEMNPVSLCRALSTRMDPEELKMLGNEDYRNGRFAEALSLYEAAIAIDPDKASYRSNKSAALVALGKLLEAAIECREAIRIDPFYQRAHNRLAVLYVRLGEAERALYHFKQAGSDADPDAINRAKQVLIHLNKCSEAKRQRDWSTLLKESAHAIDAGADSAPSIFGLRAEALLKINKHEEAIEAMEKSPNFDIDLCTNFFGPIWSSSLLVFQSQVHLAAGRFDEGVAAAEAAAKLEPKSKEAVRKARDVAAARANGNDLFKAARHSEACIAYGEGLSHDPHNAVLLCNRAACRSKLGQFQKAVEDCNAALRVRPSYSKARLRRADCYAKIGKWAACVEDCEALMRENPENEETGRMMREAEAQLRKGGPTQDFNAAGLLLVATNEHFRDFVASSRVCVVLFSTKTTDSRILQVVEELHRRYPLVKFLKVEVEDHPSLAKSEGINTFPAFIIYTNGSRASEIAGDKFDLLERSIKGCLRS